MEPLSSVFQGREGTGEAQFLGASSFDPIKGLEKARARFDDDVKSAGIAAKKAFQAGATAFDIPLKGWDIDIQNEFIKRRNDIQKNSTAYMHQGIDPTNPTDAKSLAAFQDIQGQRQSFEEDQLISEQQKTNHKTQFEQYIKNPDKYTKESVDNLIRNRSATTQERLNMPQQLIIPKEESHNAADRAAELGKNIRSIETQGEPYFDEKLGQAVFPSSVTVSRAESDKVAMTDWGEQEWLKKKYDTPEKLEAWKELVFINTAPQKSKQQLRADPKGMQFNFSGSGGGGKYNGIEVAWQAQPITTRLTSDEIRRGISAAQDNVMVNLGKGLSKLEEGALMLPSEPGSDSFVKVIPKGFISKPDGKWDFLGIKISKKSGRDEIRTEYRISSDEVESNIAEDFKGFKIEEFWADVEAAKAKQQPKSTPKDFGNMTPTGNL